MKLSTLYRVAGILGVPVSSLLGESPLPAPSLPAGAQEQADRLARDAAELAEAARKMSELMSAAGAAPTEASPRVIPFPSRPAAIGLLEPEADVDEPREVHWTEVPVVAFAAAGEGRAVEEPTGETKMVLNTSARLVEAGRLFVSKVIGDSMEPDFREGDFVLFERVPTAVLQKGDTALVIYAGQTMLKILDFARGLDGEVEAVRLFSLNAAPIHPGPDSMTFLGRVVEKLARVPNYRHLLER